MSKHDETPTLIDAEEAFEAGDVETALVIAEGLIGDDEANAPVEVLHLAAECLLEMQEPGEALHLLDLALAQEPDTALLVHARAVALFELCRLDEAKPGFEQAAAADLELGEPVFYLAILAERRGDLAEAERLFAEATARDPENLAVPVDWPASKIQEVMGEIAQDVPDPLGAWLRALPLSVEELPPDDLLLGEDGPVSPLVLCIFEGERHQAEGDDPQQWLSARPDRVRLFSRNLGKSALDEYELQREVTEAVLWEVADFLGLDDSHIAALGIAQDEDEDHCCCDCEGH